MMKTSSARSIFRVCSLVVLASLLFASFLTQQTPAVHAQDAYTATPASTPVIEDTNQPEPGDPPDVPTVETEPTQGAVPDEEQTRPPLGETAEPNPDPVQEPDLPTDRIIVKYRSETDAFSQPGQVSQMDRASAAAGTELNYLRAMSEDAHVLELSERLPLEQVQAISEQLMLLPEVEYAEPDAIMQPALAPNDPLYGSQWHYFGAWGINAPAAWDITTGSSNIIMAVIDTGITNHADLEGRTVPGYDFISNAWVANDGNGRDNNPRDPGDWVAAGGCGYASFPKSSSWHGTHVAGTMGAASNNGIGVAGVNWKSRILPVRVLGRCGGYASDVADAMRWATGLTVAGVPRNQHPAKVLNLSLGGSGACGSTYQSAINSVLNAGSVIVVSAGNSARDASGYQPASCNGVITVAATAGDGYRASYSNFGSSVEIAAPGGDMYFDSGVLSTLNTGAAGPVADTYTAYQGTSMAAPHVSGVVSLMFSMNPKLTPAQVLQILKSTARPFRSGGGCSTSLCGAGIVDAGAAVSAVPSAIPGLPGLLTPANNALLNSAQPVLDWRDSNPPAHHYQVQISANKSFTALAVNEQNVFDSQFTPMNLVPGRLYYWRVRGLNSIVGASHWSAARAFKTSLAQPELVSPGVAEALLTDRPTFVWDAVAGADQYSLQVSAVSSFKTLLVNKTVKLTEYSMPKKLPANKTLYWRVRAKTAVVTGAWSAGGVFKTPLAQPLLVTPAMGKVITTKRPAFDWEEVPGATSYTLQVSVHNNFRPLLIGITLSQTEYTATKDLPQNRTLYWRVRANKPGLTGPWSIRGYFKTGNPPSVPVLLSPLNNALVTDYTPLFNWKNAVRPAGTSFKHYEIQVDDNSDFSSLLVSAVTIPGDIADSDFTPSVDLASNSVYFWRVRAINTVSGVEHVSSWSKVWSFRTAILPPAGLLVTPNPENPRRPTFEWADANAPGAITGYTIQVSTTSNFSTLIINSTCPNSFYAMLKNLPSGKTLYWRVRANGANGPSAWSSTSFKTP